MISGNKKMFRFYKDSTGWYIDLPEWTGKKSDLQMVLGADTMLDILAQESSEVHITINDVDFENADLLKLTQLGDEYMGGAYYRIDKLNGFYFHFDIWLCDVTKFVFNGEMPQEIFIRKEF